MNQKSQAFTLVEILVVIGIIFILTSLVTWGIQKASRYAKNLQCLKNLKELHLNTLLYFQDNQQLPESSFFSTVLPQDKAALIRCPSISASANQEAGQRDRSIYVIFQPFITYVNSSKKFILENGNHGIIFCCDPTIKPHSDFSNGILDSGQCVQLIASTAGSVPGVGGMLLPLKHSSDLEDRFMVGLQTKKDKYWTILSPTIQP
ncbi:MAG: type II secretion system protein [Candidatus Aureabacteria bacterium]|nr:type II secretion system protein [Candidatus Auribacterota bacterium]